MAEYHVGCGAFAIYAGTLNSKNKRLWQNKTECSKSFELRQRTHRSRTIFAPTERERTKDNEAGEHL